MDDHDFDEIENPATWSDDPGIVHPPVQNRRPIVSVRFSSAELERIENEATKQGLRLTEFIRLAALSKASDELSAPGPTLVRRPA